MDIYYASKLGISGVCVSVDYKPEEQEEFNRLASKLEAIDCKQFKVNIPPSFNYGNNSATFHKQGSLVFGLMTKEEGNAFLKESLPILKKFNPGLTRKIHEFQNN